jgi:hypothetical protein
MFFTMKPLSVFPSVLTGFCGTAQQHVSREADKTEVKVDDWHRKACPINEVENFVCRLTMTEKKLQWQ